MINKRQKVSIENTRFIFTTKLQRRPQPRPLRLQQAPGQSGSDRRHGASSDGHGRNGQADPSESGKDL